MRRPTPTLKASATIPGSRKCSPMRRSGSGSRPRPRKRNAPPPPPRRRLAQLDDLQPVGLGAVPDRLLAPRQRLGDRPHRHALAGKRVQLLDLVLPPRLAVPFKMFAHIRAPLVAARA